MKIFSKITKILSVDVKNVQKVLLFYIKSKGGPLFRGGHYFGHQGILIFLINPQFESGNQHTWC